VEPGIRGTLNDPQQPLKPPMAAAVWASVMCGSGASACGESARACSSVLQVICHTHAVETYTFRVAINQHH
jgi:hypothetical protein